MIIRQSKTWVGGKAWGWCRGIREVSYFRIVSSFIRHSVLNSGSGKYCLPGLCYGIRAKMVLFMIEPISPSVHREIPTMAIPLTIALLNVLLNTASMPSIKPMPEIGNPSTGTSQANSAITPRITDAIATFSPRLRA